MATRFQIFSTAFTLATGAGLDATTSRDGGIDLDDPAQGLVNNFYPQVLSSCLAKQTWPFTLVRQPLNTPVTPGANRAVWERYGAVFDEAGEVTFHPFRFSNLFALPPKALSPVFEGDDDTDAGMPPRIGYGVVSVYEDLSHEVDRPSIPFEELRDTHLNTDAGRPIITYQRPVREESFPDTFTNYLELKLAAMMAPLVGGDQQMKNSLLTDAEDALQTAIDDAASTGTPDRLFGHNPLSSAAYGFGYGRSGYGYPFD